MRSMTRRKKLALAAGASAVALLGLGAAGAIAASTLLSPGEDSKAVIDDAARQLGVEPQALSDALKQALKNRVDEAVKAGRLTEEQGDALKERIDSDEYPLLFGHGVRGEPGLFGGPGLFGHHDHLEALSAAASYLDLTEAELREALQDKTLADIAKDKGKSVDGLVKALVAAQEKRIDRAIADGRITKQQASELKASLDEHVRALVNGEFRGTREEWRRGPWRGSFSPRGPPALFGPIA
jgi:uncharacterized protein YidB (DUF937 family)